MFKNGAPQKQHIHTLTKKKTTTDLSAYEP